MRLMLTILVATFLFWQTGLAPAPKYEDVTVAALLANPATYDGKAVRVHGFVNLEFEGNGIWKDEATFQDDYRWDGRIALYVPEALADREPEFRGRLGFVSGIFTTHLYDPGFQTFGLQDISAFEVDPSDPSSGSAWRRNPGFVLLFGVAGFGALLILAFGMNASGRRLMQRPV